MATAVAEPANRSEQSLEDEQAAELDAANAASAAGEPEAAAAHNERAERLRERISRLRDEATPPLEVAPDPEPEPFVSPEDIVVRGIDMDYPDAGGKRPTYGTLTLTGAKAQLLPGTGFKKGETITGSFVAVVSEFAEKDEHDATTQKVTDCEAKFKARVTDLRLGE